MKKNNKTEIAKVRLAPEEKETLKKYCNEVGITMSDFIRTLINKELARKEQR